MSSFDMEPVDEAQFEAFLEGRDELSQLLRKMPQPKARPEIDASILAMVAADLPAPNLLVDSGKETIQKTPAKAANQASFIQRWRMPLGLAASAMLAFPLVLLWQNGAFQQERAEMEAERKIADASIAIRETPQRAVEAPMAAATGPGVSETVAAPPVVANSPQKPNQAAQTRAAREQAEKMAEKEAAAKLMKEESRAEMALRAARDARSRAVEQADMAERQVADARRQAEDLEKQRSAREIVAQAEVDAGSSAKRAKRGGSEENYAGVAPSRAVAAAPPPMAPVAAAPMPAPAVVQSAPAPQREEVPSKNDAIAQPKAWLILIDELIKANMRQEALDEWAKFRKTYPQFPVDARLQEKIRQLQQK